MRRLSKATNQVSGCIAPRKYSLKRRLLTTLPYIRSSKLPLSTVWSFQYSFFLHHLILTSAPFIFGPPEQSVDATSSLNTSSSTIYQLISGKTEKMPEDGLPVFIDVRDTAEAHIRALQNDSTIGKRILVSGGSYTLYDVRLLYSLIGY